MSAIQGRPDFKIANSLANMEDQLLSSSSETEKWPDLLQKWSENRRASCDLVSSPRKFGRRLLPKTPPEARRHKRTVSESAMFDSVAERYRPAEMDRVLTDDEVLFYQNPKRKDFFENEEKETFSRKYSGFVASPSKKPVFRDPKKHRVLEESRNRFADARSQSSRGIVSDTFCSTGLTRFLLNNLGLGKDKEEKFDPSLDDSTEDDAYEDVEERRDSSISNKGMLDSGIADLLLNSTSPSPIKVESVSARSPKGTHSFFRASKFSNIPPTVHFCLPHQKVEKPKKQVLKMLKWCHNSLIPKVIRQILANNHFQIVHEHLYWVGYWGRHLKTSCYRNILPYQKVNHFPGTFNLGRKDRLWCNIHRMGNKYGVESFNLMPKTYVLPKDGKKLKAKMRESGSDQMFIVKPPASARGAGIRVVYKWSQVPKKQSVIVQQYIAKPLLINGSKFDLRLYVYVSSFNPLRVYLYEDGLVRFASIKYSSAVSSSSNRFMHLTNYSINKAATGEEENRSTTGVKWTVRQLWKYLSCKGHDVKKVMEEICDLILKSIISSESSINSFIHQNTDFPHISHELFGYDIILDGNLKPWLLEVNISPSLHSGTELDLAIKSPLAKDVLNLSGMQIPDKEQTQSVSTRLSPNLKEPVTPEFLDFRTKTLNALLTAEEKQKQSKFVALLGTGSYKVGDSGILDQLNPSDVRVLVETEDEFDRKGQFTRLFPSPFSSKYMQFFGKPRYYNLLLDAWTNRYFNDRDDGLTKLEILCSSGMHFVQGQSPFSSIDDESSYQKSDK